MKHATLALLLALAACSRTSAVDRNKGAPPPDAGENVSMDPSVIAPTAPAPGTGAIGSAPAPGAAPTGTAPAPDGAGAPRGRFVVCPGNPRCPPRSGQPGSGQSN